MAALTCEICGGKLVAKSGGIFECDSCGMQYDKSRIQEMVQEIKGTVKVEGTVAVQGTVKVDGPVKVEGSTNKDALLKRGQLALEDRKWDEAAEFFDEALNADAECAEAWLGKFMARGRLCRETDITALRGVKYVTDNDYQKALRFADTELKTRLQQYETTKCEHITEMGSERSKVESVRGVLIAGRARTFGLKYDGTVVATEYVGDTKDYKCEHDISGWSDIIAVASGDILGVSLSMRWVCHTVGLKRDGTVVAVGHNNAGQCNVSSWRDIVAVAAGDSHTVGLKSDGTVMAVGRNDHSQCNVSGWTDIVAVVAGQVHTVGLKSDGTVMAIGSNMFKQCNIWGWSDIVAVAAGVAHTVGLKSDGTVVAVGTNNYGRCNVSGWTDIVAVAAGVAHTVGLKSDGTVVAVGANEEGQCNVSAWTDIVAVAANYYHTVGLKRDGTVVATEYIGDTNLYYGQCDVSGWKLFNNLDTLEQEREAARTAIVAKQAALAAKQAALEEKRVPLAKLREERNALGLFGNKDKKKALDAQISALAAEVVALQEELETLKGEA